MNDNDGIYLQCPRCDRHLCLPSTTAGTQISCPDCNAPIDVPADTGIKEDSQWAWPKPSAARSDDSGRPAPTYDSSTLGDDLAPDEAEARASLRRTAEARIFELQQRGLKGANWFFWVAALSVVNSILMHAGGNLFFVVGLGVTLVADSIAKGIGEQNPALDGGLKIFAIGFAVVVALIVTSFGLLARKGYLIAFAIGMVLYLLDGLIFLLFQDIMSVAFHAWALYWMWNGFSAFRQIKTVEGDLRQQLAVQWKDGEG